MRRFVGLLTIAVMLMAVSFSSAEDFVIKNGITFGMTRQEVVDKEKEAGHVNSKGDVEYTQNILGQAGTEVYYLYDSDKKLEKVIYTFPLIGSFDSSRFYKVNDQLTSKYGQPLCASWIEGNATPLGIIDTAKEKKKAKDNQISKYTTITSQFNVASNGDNLVEIEAYAQWVIPYRDTGIFIEHSALKKYVIGIPTLTVYAERVIIAVLTQGQYKGIESRLNQ